MPNSYLVDLRLLADVKNGTGPENPISGPGDVGGFPVVDPGTPCTDSDHDGMPDEWENLYCLNPNDPTDGPADADRDGYTNVEEYLNGTGSIGDSICTRLFLPLTAKRQPVSIARRYLGWLAGHGIETILRVKKAIGESL